MGAFRHHTADLGEVQLHYVEAGPAEGPVVVLLHGFPEFWWSWHAQMEALAAAGYRVIAPDQRGYNLSSKPPRVRDYRIDKLVGDVRELVDVLGVERFTLVGHDWGGMVAWMFANDHGDRLERLVICDVPHPLRMAQGLRTLRQLRKSWYILWFQVPGMAERAIAAQDFAAVEKVMVRDRVRPERWPDDFGRRYRDAMGQPGAIRSAIHWYRAAFRDQGAIVRRLRPIEVPVLVVWGSEDRYLGLELAAPPPHLVPDARTVVLQASHWVQHDAAPELNALLLDFLGQERGGQGANRVSRWKSGASPGTGTAAQ